MVDYKKIFSAKLKYESEIAISEDRSHIINTFRKLIDLVDTDVFNEQIKRNIESCDEDTDVIFNIHKEYRQTDVFDNAEVDMMFWNLISVNFINKIYSDIIHFIYYELPNKTGDLDKIIEDYLHWDDNNF